MTEQELREKIARELFDVWKEAKSSEVDNWDDIDFETLPDTHKAEYFLTAKRIIGYLRQNGWTPPYLSPLEERRERLSEISEKI